MFVKKISIILFSLSFLCAIGFAQGAGVPAFSIQTDSVVVANNGELVPLTVKLKNEGEATFDGKLVLKTIDGIKLIGQTASSIHIDSQAQKFIPIRISIGNDVPAGESVVQFVLMDHNNSPKAYFTTTLTVKSKKLVQLSVHNPNQLMQHVGDSLKVQVQLSNRGNSDETITLTAAFPDLRGGTKVEKQQIYLASFQDTIISFNKIITRELLRVERYTVNVAALYENGQLINNVMVGVQNVSGSRTFIDPSQGYGYSSYSSNYIELSGINLFSQSEAFQLNAQNEFEVLGGSMDVNLNGYLYTHGSSRPLMSNTYIDYKKNGKGVRIGNISESLETFVNGRGVKTYIENQEKTKLLEVGWVDKTYNLLGDEFKYEGGNGYTAYAKTILKTKNEGEYTANVLYDRATQSNSENIIAMNAYNFLLKKDVTLGFDLGAGLTRLLRGEESAFEPSFAVGAKLSARFGKYNINSNNFFSTGYYPGVRRGVLQLNERLSRQFGKVSLWAGYSLYQYNPTHLQNNYIYFSSNISNARYELGTNFPIAQNMSLSLSVKHQTDEGSVGFGQENITESKMHSFKLSESINWRSRNSLHSISLSSENGFSKVPYSEQQKFQLRVNGNYNFRIFSLNSYYQQGDFTLVEAYRNAQTDESNYRFNLSGSVKKDFFQTKLKTQLNVNYNRDSYSGANFTYSGQVDYEVFPQVRFFANVYVYNYNNSAYSSFNTNLRAGVRYSLPSSRAETKGKRGDISLFMFYDNNANGIFDDGDTPAQNRIVTIGDISFISNSKGLVEYKKVPYQDYSLKMPSQDWFAIIPPSITVQHKQLSLDVPLQRTGKVVGKLFYKYDARTSEEFAEKHGGLRVWATSLDGTKNQALTNANGEFTLFLAVGEYVFSVDDNSLPKNVYTDFEPQEIKVEADQTIVIPDIELKIKQRKIEIKRFGS